MLCSTRSLHTSRQYIQSLLLTTITTTHPLPGGAYYQRRSQPLYPDQKREKQAVTTSSTYLRPSGRVQTRDHEFFTKVGWFDEWSFV